MTSRALAERLGLIAAAAILAYAPMLSIPLIADDYPNITQAIGYGSAQGVQALAHDPQFRLRTTRYAMFLGLWQVGGMRPWVYHAGSLLLHVLNAWLVFAVAVRLPRVRAAAFWAAVFFAVHEGHQEAVMWLSTIDELLMFLFGMASLWCWLERREVASAALFAGALLSKETAFMLLPLFLLAGGWREWKRVLPHAALTALAIASIVESRGNSFRFQDGSFSLSAPFWLTWPRNLSRLLWIWGWIAGAALLVLRDRKLWVTAACALAWMGIALAPYSFITYSAQIPSRLTYMASAGLAVLAGLAASRIADRRVAAAVLALILAHNVGYLWVKKRPQFLERSEPTSQLIALAQRTPGRIWVRCFPLPGIVAEEAVRLGAGKSPVSLVWKPEAGAVEFCYRGAFGGWHPLR